MSTSDWTKNYEDVLNNPPQPGDVLSCVTDEDARLDVELVEGRPPFIYGRAYIPCIVGQASGWFLQPFDSDTAHGWKCILLPKAREECIRKRGLKEPRIAVRSLKVVRVSESGQSLLCEVAQYDADEQVQETENTDEQVQETENTEEKAE